MKNRLLLLLVPIAMFSGSKDDEEEVLPEPALSEYELDVIDYFKDIALGFEFGSASNITRKWNSEMRIFIGGEPNAELLNELEVIRTELNQLVTDGFSISMVSDSLEANYYMFFGTGAQYADLFPNQSGLVDANWGLFSVAWNGQNQITSGQMYVDIVRADMLGQRHLLHLPF